REVAATASWSVLLLGLGGAAAIAGTFFFPAAIAFLFDTRQAPLAVRTSVLWLAPVGGLLAGALLYWLARPGLLGASAFLGARLGRSLGLGSALFQRYLSAPVLGAVGAVEEPALEVGESGFGLALFSAGRQLRRLGTAAPLLPLLLILAVLLVLVVGLATPGLAR